MKRTILGFALALSATATADVSAGQRAAEFNLPSLSGGNLSLASLKGKVVLLDFWASWCGPCKEELPELEKIKAAYAAKGVAVVTVNIDKDRENAQSMVKKLKLTLAVALDPSGGTAGKYGLPTMPSSYVVDKTGVVRYVHEGFRSGDQEKMKRELDELLAK